MLQDAVLYAIAILLFVRRAIISNSKKDILFLMAFLAAGVALAFYENASISIMVEGILIFNGVVSSYHSKDNYLLSLLAVFFILPFSPFATLLSQSMLLGFLSGAYFFLESNHISSSKIEKMRDVVQIIFGIMFVAAFAIFQKIHFTIAVMLLILVASAIGNYSTSNKKSGVSKILYAFERKNATFGQGAMWLAMGTLAALSFLSTNQIIAVVSAVIVGDAVATLAGTAIRIPIPYNKRKSVVGTAAYFISASVMSFPFIGPAGILTSLVAALVESAPKQIDDNFDTAVVLIVLIKLLEIFAII
jgi:phytol kinase